MSIITKPLATGAKLVVNKTIDGKTKEVSRTYGNVKPEATDDAVFNTMDALAELQVNPVNRIVKVDNTELSETM